MNLPPGLERILRRCLEKDPRARFQTAQDLAFNLESLSLGNLSQPVYLSKPLTPARFHGWAWLGAAGIGLVLILGLA